MAKQTKEQLKADLTKNKRKRELLIIRAATDSIIAVQVDIEHIPADRYRGVLSKLRSDEAILIDKIGD